MRTSQMLSQALMTQRIREEDSLPSNTFTCTVAKGVKYGVLVVAVIGLGMGYFLSVPIQDPQVGILFAGLGFLALLMLPTYFTYRCYVDKSILKASYCIFCFPIRKEILWNNVAYKKVNRDSLGNALSIRLYDSRKKKLISFDYSITGLGKIVRMAKKIPAKKQ